MIAFLRRHRFGVALLGLALVAAAAVVVHARSPAQDTAPPPPSFDVELVGPERIDVGDSWTFETLTALPTTSVSVVVSGPWGSEHVTAVVDDDTITVPGRLTTHSGRLLATVQSGSGRGTVAVDVDPGPAVEGTMPLAGPRSMIADLVHWTMVTSLPRDRFGNVVADGTPVDVVVRRPGGQIEVVTAEVDHLLAAVRVFSETLTGRSTLRIDVADASGQEVEVLEVPGPPVEVVVEPPTTPLLRADGRQLAVVSTRRLVDQYGNELLDGTAAMATIDGPTGRSTLRSVTIDARAEFVLEAPPLPGEVTVEVLVDGVRSEPTTFDYVVDVATLPLELERVDDRVVVEIGRVTTALGGYVPDGTEAEVTADGEVVVAALRDGAATVELDVARDTEITVEVLGVARTVEAP